MRRLSFASLALLVACGGSDGAEPAPTFEPWFDAGENWLVDVTVSQDDAVFLAVGGTLERGRVWMGDETIAEVDVDDVPLLNWVHAFSATRAIAVGNGGAIVRFDGTRFVRQESPTEQDLWGVWGASDDDVWAVGGDGRAEGNATLLHFDGGVWSEVTLPALERPRVWAFFKVWGASADDVYVVGQSGAALHFDGTEWSELSLGTSEDLISLSGTSKDRITIVGGRSSGVIVTYDGSTFQTTSLAPLPGLNGVWMKDPDTVYVAGILGTLAKVDFDSLEVQEIASEPRATTTFHAVYGRGDRVVAVGGNLDNTVPPYTSLAYSFTGSNP